MFLQIIDARDDGQTQHHGFGNLLQTMQAVLPERAAGPCTTLQFFRIREFIIQQKQIGQRKQGFQHRGGNVAIGFQTGVNLFLPGQGKQFQEKIRLQGGFSAGNGKAAFRSVIGKVSQYHFHDLPGIGLIA